MNTNKKALKPANGWLLLKHTDQESIIIVKSTPYANKQLLGREELGAEGMEVELIDIKKAPPAHALKDSVRVTYDTPFPLHVRDVAGVYDDSTEDVTQDYNKLAQTYTESSVVGELDNLLSNIDNSNIQVDDRAHLYSQLSGIRKAIMIKIHKENTN